MLRRKPTAIQITAEDIASYEDRQAAAAQAEAVALAQAQFQAQAEFRLKAQAQQGQSTPQNRTSRVELSEVPGVPPKERVKTREERLGLGPSSRR